MNNSYNALRNITSFRNTGKSQPISGIELMVDEKNMYFAGNDDGYVMTIDCPYGTQEMANDLLAKAKGFEYQGFTAEQIILPPEAELGDGVTVAGIYGMVARRSFKFTPGMTSNIEAPRELEVQHEYKYSSPQQRKTERQIAETRSTFTKTAEEITLRVDGLDESIVQLSVSVDGIRSEVAGKIDSEDAQTLIDQSIDKIELSVSSGSSGTTFTLKAGEVTLSTESLNLHVNSANIDGKLTIGQLPSNIAQTNQIPTKLSELTNDSGYQTETGVTTIIGGTVTADYVNALGVEAVSLVGNTIGIKYRYLDGNLQIQEGLSGHLTTYDTTSGPGLGMVSESGLKLLAGSGSNVFLASSGGNGSFISLYPSFVQLGGGRLVIGSDMYGNSVPSNPVQGTLYFLRKS